jgi:hypothetical protein
MPLIPRRSTPVNQAEIRAFRSGKRSSGRVASAAANPPESPFKKAKREAGKQQRRGRG